MTREEGIAHINTVNRYCRGASLFTQEERMALEHEGNTALSPYNYDAAYALKRRLETKFGQYDQEIHSVDEMAQRLVFLIYARPDIMGRPCGFNYNTFIEANPWDGKVYETTCPLCGTQDKYQAPHLRIK